MVNISSRLRYVGLALAVAAILTACNFPNATTSSSAETLVSATNNWIGHSGHYVAVKQELFQEAGVKVNELFFQSSSEMLTAFMAGKADVAWLTTGDAIQAAEKDPSVRIIYLVDYSNGADGIVGRNIKTPKDIKGKTIARENILFAKVILQAYLTKAGLSENDVQVQDLLAADAATAFAAKKVDAAITYEPYMGKAAKTGGGEVIFSTKNTNLVADAIVVRQKTIQTRKAELQKYLKAVDKGIKLIQSGDAEALKAAAAKMGVSVDEVKAQLSGAKLFDLEGNQKIAFNKSNPNSIIGNLKLTLKTAIATNTISKPIDPKTLYDASLVEGK